MRTDARHTIAVQVQSGGGPRRRTGRRFGDVSSRRWARDTAPLGVLLFCSVSVGYASAKGPLEVAVGPPPRSSAPQAVAVPLASGVASASVSASSRYRPLVVTLPPLRDEGVTQRPTASDRYFSDYRPVRTPVVRVAIGPGFRMQGQGENAFVLDALVGARLGLHPGARQWGLFPEGGYSYNKANHENALTAGVGLGFGELPYWGYFALMPRFVWRPGHAVGGRLGLAAQVTETGLSAELAVQRMILPGGETSTDLRFTLGLDVFLLGSVVSGNRDWKEAARP
jgi:hypothetical protein